MTIDTSITRVLHGLNTGVHEHSSSYFHTRPIAEERASFVLPSKRKYSFDIFYDIKDLFTHYPYMLIESAGIYQAQLRYNRRRLDAFDFS